MRLSRRQLRRLIESALHEQSGLSANPFGEPSAADSEKELADMRLPSRTYDYGDGYTYAVMPVNGEDMWHVIRGGKKMAEKTSDFISMEKYPDNMANLDAKFPDARSSEAKNKNPGMTTRDRQRGQQDLLNQLDDQVQGDEMRGEQIDKAFDRVNQIIDDISEIVMDNDEIADPALADANKYNMTSTNIKLDPSLKGTKSPAYKAFIKAHQDLKKAVENAKKVQIADPADNRYTLLIKAVTDYEKAFEKAFTLTKQTGSLSLGDSLAGEFRAASDRTLIKLPKFKNLLPRTLANLRKVQKPGSSNSGGSTSGGSQVAVQREGLSRGSMYRRRYRRY